MVPGKATARAHPNIAFIKYWGQSDPARNLPANPSLSMGLDGLYTLTTVQFREAPVDDLVLINGQPVGGRARERVTVHLDRIREQAGVRPGPTGGAAAGWPAVVVSRSNFPAGTGLASSASAFAALTLAAVSAAGLTLGEAELSRLARLGSGSACRSLPGGFVVWQAETAQRVAPAAYWELHDVVALVSREAKAVASVDGHRLAPTSPLHAVRLAGVEERLAAVRQAILARDLEALGRATEADTWLMLAVMWTSIPPLVYLTAGSLAVIRALTAWRAEGLPVYYTLDAGPNVHCLCQAGDAPEVVRRLREVPGVDEVLDCRPGGSAQLIESHLI